MIPLVEESPAAPPAPRKARVLLTAATRWEAVPLARALNLAATGEGRWGGQVAGSAVTLVKTGIGEIATSQTLDRDFKAVDFDLTISAGLCGAMQPDIRRGDLVADPHEAEMEYVVPLRETARALSIPFHFGRILHTKLVLKPQDKRALGAAQRVVACDMETAAVRVWSRSKSPVLGVRAVLDEIDEEIPSSAPTGEDALSLARFALAHAGELPVLLRTGWRSSRSMRSLSRFLKRYLEIL